MVAKSKKSVAAAAKPVRKATAKPVVKPAVATAKVVVTPEQRQRMIEVSAYYLAEKNGFKGDGQQYWLQAEREVEAKLGKK
jgi:hypothetical protein